MVLLAVCGWLVAGCDDQSDGDECDEQWLSVELIECIHLQTQPVEVKFQDADMACLL